MRGLLKKIVTLYLHLLTRLVIYRRRPDIIAVAGISNKTTIKKSIAKRLRMAGLDVRANPRSYNTEIGLPLAVFSVEMSAHNFSAWFRAMRLCARRALFDRKFPRLLVLEFGVSDRGDMQQLLKIARPRIAVFSNIKPSEYNPQTSIEELTAEMSVLIAAIPANGLIIYNQDDAHLVNLANKYTGKKISYGIENEADFRARDVRMTNGKIEWLTDGKKKILPKSGFHHVYAELAADAVQYAYAAFTLD